MKAAPSPIHVRNHVRNNTSKSKMARNVLPVLYAEQRFCVSTKLDLLSMYNAATVLALDTQMLLSNLQQRIATLDSLRFEIGDAIYMNEQELMHDNGEPMSPLPPLMQLPEAHEDNAGVQAFVPAPLAPF